MKQKTGTKKPKTTSETLAVQGAIWLMAGGENLGGNNRIALLRAIAEKGSITQAAKAIKMSYKAAWDAIDTMNNLAGEPLVERISGGRGGGATRLTLRGEQLVKRFAELDALHLRFVQLLSYEAIDLGKDLDVLRMLNMKISARNQLVGTVTAIKTGAVNDEIQLTLPGGARVTATVTRESTESLGLQIGTSAFALIKASSIIVATDASDVQLSASNQLHGVITVVTPGAVNAEVVIDIDGGGSIAAIVTQASANALKLAVGERAAAIFKASSVILGVHT